MVLAVSLPLPFYYQKPFELSSEKDLLKYRLTRLADCDLLAGMKKKRTRNPLNERQKHEFGRHHEQDLPTHFEPDKGICRAIGIPPCRGVRLL